MKTWSLLSIGAFYLGALNTVLARVAGTCTQGDADRLLGVMVSAVLYLFALGAMKMSGSERRIIWFILPVIPVLLWQAVFALRLSYEVLWLDASACTVLEGVPYPMSGHEPFVAVAWPAMAIIVLIGFAAVWVSRSPQS